MSSLSVRRLSAGYGPLRVIHDLDLEVDDGERVCLVGLNGHGKSTLLRSIVGLVDWRHGDIEVDGRQIRNVSPHALARRGVVLVPQGDALFPGLSVMDNLDVGAYACSWRSRHARRARVLELFPHLADRARVPAGVLSGGERRMLSIGRGLMQQATLYLIDEPSLGLAPKLGRDLLDKLTSLDLGATLVLAEQNRSLVEGRIDRILQVHAGRIATDEPAATAAKH